MSRYDDLSNIAQKLNQTPKDVITNNWGNCLSSSFIHQTIDNNILNHKKFFRKKHLPFCRGNLYIYSFPSYRVFEIIKNNPILQECRGLITTQLGVRCRPLPVMETRSWTHFLDHINNPSIDITIKIDGQMVLFIHTLNGYKPINKAGKIIKLPKKLFIQVKNLISDAEILGLTPVFEYTDIDKPNVLRSKTGITLVGLRSILTGKIAHSSELIYIAKQYGIGHVLQVTSINDLPDSIIEGVVVNDKNNIWRAKTPEFIELRKLVTSFRYHNSDEVTQPELISEKDIKFHLPKKEFSKWKRRKKEK